MTDKTGRFCDRNQTNAQIWFLAGTFGGEAKRRCSVSSGRAILFPVINDLITYAEYPHLVNEEELRTYAKDDLDRATQYEVYVDGIQIERVKEYRIQSNLFKIDIPYKEWHVSTEGISDGYWILLKPFPSRSTHVISFRGEKLRYDEIYGLKVEGDLPKFNVKVTYDITVS